MPIPVNQMLDMEIVVNGLVSAGGSSTVKTANIFHFQRTTNANPISKTNIDTAFNTAIVTSLALALNARWTQQNNTVRCINDPLDSPVIFSHGAIGAVAGDSMTSIEAAFILMKTGLRGKSYRGSKHFGPLSESDTTSGTDDIFNAAALTRWGAVVSAINGGFTDANGNIWLPTVVSRKLSNFTATPAVIVANVVSQILLNKRIGRLRRREAKSVY